MPWFIIIFPFQTGPFDGLFGSIIYQMQDSSESINLSLYVCGYPWDHWWNDGQLFGWLSNHHGTRKALTEHSCCVVRQRIHHLLFFNVAHHLIRNSRLGGWESGVFWTDFVWLSWVAGCWRLPFLEWSRHGLNETQNVKIAAGSWLGLLFTSLTWLMCLGWNYQLARQFSHIWFRVAVCWQFRFWDWPSGNHRRPRKLPADLHSRKFM